MSSLAAPCRSATPRARGARSVVWWLSDGKAGHESQSRGLIASLRRRADVDDFRIPVASAWKGGWSWMRGRYDDGADLPAPDLIIAAGHATHLAALAGRAARGGHVVLLMCPSLPLRWFDLCLIPEHDVSGTSASVPHNVVVTRGVLNCVRPAPAPDGRRGLLLVGGPSKHHGWDDRHVAEQIVAVADADPSIQWTLTSSRRTPESLISRIEQQPLRNLQVIPFRDTGPGWLAAQLAEAGTVFVTEDSVSMIYEALSSAAHVGLLSVPRRRTSRVVRGIDRLIEDRLVIPWEQWRSSRFDQRNPVVLQEADRCAEIICKRLLDAA